MVASPQSSFPHRAIRSFRVFLYPPCKLTFPMTFIKNGFHTQGNLEGGIPNMLVRYHGKRLSSAMYADSIAILDFLINPRAGKQLLEKWFSQYRPRDHRFPPPFPLITHIFYRFIAPSTGCATSPCMVSAYLGGGSRLQIGMLIACHLVSQWVSSPLGSFN